MMRGKNSALRDKSSCSRSGSRSYVIFEMACLTFDLERGIYKGMSFDILLCAIQLTFMYSYLSTISTFPLSVTVLQNLTKVFDRVP